MTNTTATIKDIVAKNRYDIAFLIGNGIHCQFKDCNLTWRELLQSLWCEYVNDGENLPDDISFTEIYDIIEMNARDKVKRSFITEIMSNIRHGASFNLEQSDKLQSILNSNYKTSFDIRKISKPMKELLQEIIGTSRKWCNDNMDNAEDLTDEKCVDQYMSLIYNPEKLQIYKNEIKQAVAKKFPTKKTYKLKDCISYLENLNAPVLTTNFDTYMSDSIGAKRYIISPTGTQYKFTDFYPWNVYFSTHKLNNPLEGFGIWHINGITTYPRSIKLGLSDYMGCVERARKMIQGSNLNEYFNGKQQNYWSGYNTWLHIIFNKNLFVFGLALDQNEVFLRWLLIQRAKYCRMYNQPLKGWYVGKNISIGKKYFLKYLGFEVIELSEYNELYNAFN